MPGLIGALYMRSKFGFRVSTSFAIAAIIFPVSFSLVAAPAFAKKEKEEVVEECPVDTTIRTADPNLLKRFRSLAGCEEQLLVAPASETDYVEPDGRIIIAERDDGGSVYADNNKDGEYRLQYAGIDSDTEDIPKKKKGRLSANAIAEKDKGTKVQVYSYGAQSRSLAGTGTVVRIVPEEQPVPAPAVSGEYAADLGTPHLAANAAPAAGSGILAMRPQSYRTRFDDIISQTANNHRIDPLFLHAVIQQESGYRHTVRSHAGAQGLMQIMPGTGRMLGVHPAHLNDPVINVDAGARLLRRLYFRYNGDFKLVLAAYNAGEGAVQKYGNRVPPYRETQDYVVKVMQRYNKLLTEQNGVASQP
jgi:Transglycosylase SLT domain